MQGFFYICDYWGIIPTQFFNEEEKHPLIMRELINNAQKLNGTQLQLLSHFIKSL